MELIRFQNVSKDYGHRQILEDVSFRLLPGRKVGLIGANGAGKTSILRILLGDEPASGGAITRAPGLRIGYVPQQVAHDNAARVLDTVLAANNAARDHLRTVEEQLSHAGGDEIAAAIDAYEDAREAYERAGGEQMRARATAMLDGLGLGGRQDQLVGALSGGEKNVLSLTQALLAEPDLLVLDEPGNHLDFAGITWLEEFLRKFRGAVLLVSHNRYLLDRVADTILHLEQGKVQTYSGNYSSYRAQALRAKVTQQADYVVNQRRLQQLEELVKRFEELARRTGDAAWGKRLKARRSQLRHERDHAVEKPAEEASKLRMALTAEASRADIALQVRGYCKAFGERVLFEHATTEIRCGERVALLGPNGSGKTTLLRDVIARGAWDDDVLRIGPSLRVGYCAQEQEVLNDNRTVLDEILREGLSRERAFALLSSFLFGRDDLSKRVGQLSGGERNRLQLARLMAQQPDFLILDEPTNHLDIPACEAIEDALAEFRGTILAVSHDRYFLDKIVDRVIEVADAQLVSYDGNFSEYWHERYQRPVRVTARVATRGRERGQRRAPAPQADGRERELRVRIEEAEREKVALEKRIADAFGRGDHVHGRRTATELERHTARLNELYERWVEVEEGSGR